MAFEGLAEKLSNSFKKLRSKGKLTEADVKEAMREVRLLSLIHISRVVPVPNTRWELKPESS